MAARVLLVRKLLSQPNVKEENHCEAQSFTRTMDRQWRPAKMADIMFALAAIMENLLYDLRNGLQLIKNK